MKKSYQGYIESENFGQSPTFVAFKIAIEKWSVYRTRVVVLPSKWPQNLKVLLPSKWAHKTGRFTEVCL